jgi:hypothetical protein
VTTGTETAAGFTKARRGDAIVVHECHRDFISGEGTRVHDTFEVGIVTGITRDGLARTWRPARASLEDHRVPLPSRHEFLWVVPATGFDIPAVIQAARDHKWPGHEHENGLPMPFGSLAEVKAAIGPCRKAEG